MADTEKKDEKKDESIETPDDSSKKPEKDDKKDEKKPEKKTKEPREKKPAKSAGPRKSLSNAVWIIICVVALVGGILIGHFLIGSSSTSVGTTTVEESALDDSIATYTYNGKTTSVTTREVLEQNGDVSEQANDDGTYTVPSADTIISYIRNEIVLQAAEDQGIDATDDEVDSYATSTLGTSDYATIGSNYGLSEDATKALLKDATIMKKLRDTVVTTEVPDAPSAPSTPEDGNEDTASSEYAQYIIELAGDEWDSENNTWARTDGEYYSALSTYDISNDSATYAAAEQAYYVAYSDYSTASSEASSEWTAYVNSLLDASTVQINTLAV